MKINRKRRIEDTLKFLVQASVTHEIQQVHLLLDDLYEVRRDELVDARSDDFFARQAEVRVYRDLLRMLRNARPQIQPAQETA